MYWRDGKVWTVTDDVPPRPRKPQATADAGSWLRLSDFASPGTLPVMVLLMMLIGGVKYARRKE